MPSARHTPALPICEPKAHHAHRAVHAGELIAVLACCVGLAAAPRGSADEVTSGPDYVSVLPGYSFPSKAYGTTGNGATVSGIYGRQIDAHLGFEANIQSSTFETGIKGGTDFYQNGATLDLTYAFLDRHAESFVTPFVLMGLGAVYDDFYPNNRDGIAFVADAGLGVVSRPLFSNGIRLRLDARYVHDGKEGGHGEGRVLAGIEIPLGRVEVRVLAP